MVFSRTLNFQICDGKQLESKVRSTVNTGTQDVGFFNDKSEPTVAFHSADYYYM